MKLIVALGAALAFALYLLWGTYGALSDVRSERDDLIVKLDAEKLRTQRLQRSVLAAKAKADSATRSLKEATDANPEDRDAAVPVPVRDSLCRTLRCP